MPVPGPLTRRVPLGFLVCALLATGCTIAAGPHPSQRGPRSGGTLYVLVETDDFPHIDPQRTHYTPATNVVRLFTRTLTTYRPAAGRGGSELVPDLATDLGRPTQRNTVWQFTLKPKLKWEDGSEVTCEDVKYGVERSFSEKIDGGASIYPRTYLKGAATYQGPYQDGDSGAGLPSVTCLDPRTVQFELVRPVGDFGYVTALSVFAPVPAARDTGEDYDRRPFSNGPYKVVSYAKATENRERELVLERNRHWSPRTDPARQQHPTRIVVRFGADADLTTHRMIENQGDHRYAVALDSRVSPRFVQQVINDPYLSARTVTGTTSAVRYLAINTESVPDVPAGDGARVRQAGVPHRARWLPVRGLRLDNPAAHHARVPGIRQVRHDFATGRRPGSRPNVDEWGGMPGHADFGLYGESALFAGRGCDRGVVPTARYPGGEKSDSPR